MKIILSILAFFLILTSPAQSDELPGQYASTRTDGVMRVGISTNDFDKLDYKTISLFSEGKMRLYDGFFNTQLGETSPGDTIKFEINDTSFSIYKNDKEFKSSVFGPIEVEPTDENPINVAGLKRKGQQAAYRGKFEVVRVPGKKGKFYLVNILALEDYLKGVVPNELPPHFGMEALKAQAVAARNYAIRPRVKIYPHFDVCDSVKSQVYFGYNTEKPESNTAIEETGGLVALHEGEVIIALYSSAAGGYTENYENAFAEPGGGEFPAKPLPYLKGKPDIEGTPVLDNEKAARDFYTSKPEAFDANSGYYRWTREWTGEELRKELNESLNHYTWCDLITPQPKGGMDTGKIKRVDVVSRGVSGKAIAISVKTEKGEWIIRKELFIRRIFKNKGKALPSANLVFNNYTDKDGYLVRLEAFGGGFGHGVGMSQHGASYMSKNGYSFDRILQHYYDGIAVGTWPVYMAAEYVTPPIKQEFVSPDKKADLLIENYDGVEKFELKINSKKILLEKTDLKDEQIRISLDKYLEKANEIIYYPLENEEEGRSLKVWVEVFRREN